MTELFVYTGNIDHGRKVFDSASCSKCHPVRGKGTNFGPEFSEISDKLSKQGLYQSILDPSESVSESFKTVIAALADGRVINGFITSEAERELIIRSEGGKQTTIEKSPDRRANNYRQIVHVGRLVETDDPR